MAWTYYNKPPMGWPLDLSEPINEGLVGHWYMPEGSGNKIFDLSGNGNNGTFQGTAPSWTSGKFGSAVKLPATGGEYINAGTTGFNWQSGTISIWVRKLSHNESDEQLLSSVVDSTHRIYINWGSGEDRDVCQFALAAGSAKTTYRMFASAPAFGQWYHLVFIWDSSISKMWGYVDGVLGSDGMVAITITSNFWASEFHLGKYYTVSSEYLDCEIDNLSIYNRALSASEVALLTRFPFYGFANPDEIPVLDQYYTVAAAADGIMTPNTGYWGAI